MMNNEGSSLDHEIDREAHALRAVYAPSQASMLKMTRVMQDTVTILRSDGRLTHATLWNTCLFLNLAAHDLSVLIEGLVLERDYWKRRFVARQVAVLAFETVEDMPTLLGKEFRGALQRLGVFERFAKDLSSAQKPLNQFWLQHKPALQLIRSTSGAHRDHDTLTILSTIEDINIDDVLTIGLALQGIWNDLGKILQTIATETASLPPPEMI